MVVPVARRALLPQPPDLLQPTMKHCSGERFRRPTTVVTAAWMDALRRERCSPYRPLSTTPRRYTCTVLYTP